MMMMIVVAAAVVVWMMCEVTVGRMTQSKRDTILSLGYRHVPAERTP